MNRLQLAQQLHRLCEIAGSITSTVNQTNEVADMVNFLDLAYEIIQNQRESWYFLHNDFSFNTVSGTDTYAKTVVTDLAEWRFDPEYESLRFYLTASGLDAEQRMYLMEWNDFRRIYKFGQSRNTTGKPQYFAIKPDESMAIYPTPDDIYTIEGEYYKIPDIMREVLPDSIDDYVPIFPPRFHMAIVWKALELWAIIAEEPNKVSMGEMEFNRVFSELEFDQHDRVKFGPPLERLR